MSKSSAGLLDTNVLIHALTTDAKGEECRAFLARLRSGEQSCVLTSVVAFEFTYAVGRYAKQMTRAEIGEYLISVMVLPSVMLEDDLLIDAIRLWSGTPDLGFVDAYLGQRAERDQVPVFTKNLKHFRQFDVELPDPLESDTPENSYLP